MSYRQFRFGAKNVLFDNFEVAECLFLGRVFADTLVCEIGPGGELNTVNHFNPGENGERNTCAVEEVD